MLIRPNTLCKGIIKEAHLYIDQCYDGIIYLYKDAKGRLNTCKIKTMLFSLICPFQNECLVLLFGEYFLHTVPSTSLFTGACIYESLFLCLMLRNLLFNSILTF